MKPIQLPFYARLAFLLVIIIAGAYICIVGQNLIVPLLFSFLFAILLLPVANFFERKARLSRTLSSIISVILFVLVISVVMYLLGSQITNLASEWPSLKEQLIKLSDNVRAWLVTRFHVNLEKQTAYINNATANLLKSSGGILEKTVLSVSSIILFLILIQLIGFSRVYLRVHYASDVAVGYIVGTSWLLVALGVLKKIEDFNKQKLVSPAAASLANK